MGDIVYNKETLERLVRLEEHVKVRFKELDKALNIAREGIDYRLAGMNEFQKRIDRLEGSFATKEQLSVVSKVVYVGFGILLGLQALGAIFFKIWLKGG